jgi:hypothetical protein
MLEVRKRNIDYLTLGERHWAYEQVPSKEYGISFFAALQVLQQGL